MSCIKVDIAIFFVCKSYEKGVYAEDSYIRHVIKTFKAPVVLDLETIKNSINIMKEESVVSWSVIQEIK